MGSSLLRLTVRLNQSSTFFKLGWGYTRAIVSDYTFPPVSNNIDIDLRGMCIERVLQQLDTDAIERGDGDGGFDLGNDLGWERRDGS